MDTRAQRRPNRGSRHTPALKSSIGTLFSSNASAPRSLVLEAPRTLENRGVESAQKNRGESPMNTPSCVSIAPVIEPTAGVAAHLDRLGDEIAELSAHLDAAGGESIDWPKRKRPLGATRAGRCRCINT